MALCFLALPWRKLKSTFCGLHTTAWLVQWPVVLGSGLIPSYLGTLYSFAYFFAIYYYHCLASELMLDGKPRQFGCKLTEFPSGF